MKKILFFFTILFNVSTLYSQEPNYKDDYNKEVIKSYNLQIEINELIESRNLMISQNQETQKILRE